MAINSRITFRHMRHDASLEELIRGKIDKLERFNDRISSCEVILETPHRSKGVQYHIRIVLGLPGGDVVVERDPPAPTDPEQLQAAIRDAFDAARRQLKERAERRRGD